MCMSLRDKPFLFLGLTCLKVHCLCFELIVDCTVVELNTFVQKKKKNKIYKKKNLKQNVDGLFSVLGSIFLPF